jgi:hypothetical protein
MQTASRSLGACLSFLRTGACVLVCTCAGVWCVGLCCVCVSERHVCMSAPAQLSSTRIHSTGFGFHPHRTSLVSYSVPRFRTLIIGSSSCKPRKPGPKEIVHDDEKQPLHNTHTHTHTHTHTLIHTIRFQSKSAAVVAKIIA